MARLGGLQTRGNGLYAAKLADEEHVGVRTQRTSHTVCKAGNISTDFILGNDRAQPTMLVFDGIVMVTARADEVDRVVGFELGADDYVVKPFSPREVVARVRAILRRSGMKHDPGPQLLRLGRLEIDEAAREARVDGRDVGLKPREYALLLTLAGNPGVALSRDTLLERVWGYDFDGDERTVDVHVRRLRMKLEEQHRLEICLHTVHGFGYKFAQA